MDSRVGWSVLALSLILLLALTTVWPARGTGDPVGGAGDGRSGTVIGATRPLSPSGIIIPLYAGPGPDWSSVIQAKRAHPALPFIVIVNPSSGPGAARKPGFATGVDGLKSAGIQVFGYVYTGNGRRNASRVEAEISAYESWYGVQGIFFDGMPNVPGYEGYYSALGSYAKSLGLYTAGNPGTTLPRTYAGILDLYVLDEGPSPPTSRGGFPLGSTASLVYGVPSITRQYVSSLSRLSGYVYITDQGLPNPYNALPSYFDSLVSLLAGSDGEPGSSTAAVPCSSATAGVEPC